MIVRIAGAVIRLYVGKGELLGHLDQGDLIRERSVSIRIGVALPDGGSYPWEPFYHGLHGVEPLGEHLLQILRFELDELFATLLQMLGVFFELLLQALDFRGELGILRNLYLSSV
ncbi:hypothetical protein F2Q69_00035311 [Brassica cretica]|uniref:Uncharacterized protein n=1 Tax=Brassica cretica TaxID=69181 RepID=A0A8S9SMW6_BRACR|nr:hypothetical protein F2Q69_00035311 [Brassica cretica]